MEDAVIFSCFTTNVSCRCQIWFVFNKITHEKWSFMHLTILTRILIFLVVSTFQNWNESEIWNGTSHITKMSKVVVSTCSQIMRENVVLVIMLCMVLTQFNLYLSVFRFYTTFTYFIERWPLQFLFPLYINVSIALEQYFVLMYEIFSTYTKYINYFHMYWCKLVLSRPYVYHIRYSDQTQRSCLQRKVKRDVIKKQPVN